MKWKVLLLARLIKYFHTNPSAAGSLLLCQYQMDKLMDYLELEMSRDFCGAGFRYNHQHCLKCGAGGSVLLPVEFPFVNYCTECTINEKDIHPYTSTVDVLPRYNPALKLVMRIDPVLQREILNKLID